MSIPTSNISITTLNDYFGWKSNTSNLLKNASQSSIVKASNYSLSKFRYFKAKSTYAESTANIKISDFSGINYNFSINYANSLVVPNMEIGLVNLDFKKNFIIDLNMSAIPDSVAKIFQTGRGLYTDSGFTIYVVSTDSVNYYLNVKWGNEDTDPVTYNYLFSSNITIPKSDSEYKLTLIYDGTNLYANTSVNTLVTSLYSNLVVPSYYSYNSEYVFLNSNSTLSSYNLYGLRIFGSLYDYTNKINAIVLNDYPGNVALILDLNFDIFLNNYIVVRNVPMNRTFCFGKFTGSSLGKYILTEQNYTYLSWGSYTISVNYSPGVTAGIVFGNTPQIEVYNTYIASGNDPAINVLPIFRYTFNKVTINIANGSQYNYNSNKAYSWNQSYDNIYFYDYSYDYNFIPYFNGLNYVINGALISSDVSLISNSIKVYFDKNYGTIGRGSAGPGFIYSSTGADFITPGTPFECFGFVLNNSTNLTFENNVNTYQGKFYQKSNNYIAYMSGNVNSGFVSCQYILSTDTNNNMVLKILMSYTNSTSSSMTIKAFRTFDPDQDFYTYGVYNTYNKRGFGDIPANQFVTSLGLNSKIRVSLYYPGYPKKSVLVSGNIVTTDFAFNIGYDTSISPGWAKNPGEYLSGSNTYSGAISDSALGIGWDLGTIQPGETFSIPCYYIVTKDDGYSDENTEATRIKNIINSIL